VEITLIIGQKEAIDGTVIVKNMKNGTQETVIMEKLVPMIKKMLKSDVVISKTGNV